MKLYNSKVAPNPRRVRIFLSEKGVSIPPVEVDLATLEHKTAEFSAINLARNLRTVGDLFRPVEHKDVGRHPHVDP